jgi:peptide chain release factor 2
VTLFDILGLTERLNEINAATEGDDFWVDHIKAQELLKEKKSIESKINEYKELEKDFEDIRILIDLAQEEDDHSLAPEIQDSYDAYIKKFEELRIKTLLNGEYDANNAIISIHAGSGGTDAQDWAEMLLRMYTRWSESKKYKVKILDYQDADEGGIKSATLPKLIKNIAKNSVDSTSKVIRSITLTISVTIRFSCFEYPGSSHG